MLEYFDAYLICLTATPSEGERDSVRAAFAGGSDVAVDVHVRRVFLRSGLVIGNASFEDVVHAIYTAQETLLREVNPVVMSASEFSAKALQGDRFVSRIVSEPKIFLKGGNDELGELAANRPA